VPSIGNVSKREANLAFKYVAKASEVKLDELNTIVRGTNQFRQAESEGGLVRLPSGDGMALVFRDTPESPAQCALEIGRALRNHPRLQVRMGIHSGPVNEVPDVALKADRRGKAAKRYGTITGQNLK
jgi:hypothetical protein